MTASDEEIFGDQATPSFCMQVNDACEKFEQAWKSGCRPNLPTFLQSLALPVSQLLLQELIKLDVHYRRTNNEPVSASDYAVQFPEFSESIRVLIESLSGSSSTAHSSAPYKETALLEENIERRQFSVGRLHVTQLGNFKLLEEIARGGQGIVFKAINRRTGGVVAIKVLLELAPDAIDRFLREGRLTARLAHPNIVQVHDLRRKSEVPFLVMEFVEGVDLGRLSESAGLVTIADGCEMIRQAALGLQCAHEHGLVHRDIKPSNLILSQHGNVKILDLGLAMLRNDDRPADKRTPSHTLIGTFAYMAPEQASDPRAADIRADIYSLGCTLFELLTAQQPFGDEESPITELMWAHRMAPIPRLRAFRTDIPQELDDLVCQMMAKSPADRPATPQEIEERLAPFALGSRLRELAAIGMRCNSHDEAVCMKIVGDHDSDVEDNESGELPSTIVEEITEPPSTLVGGDWTLVGGNWVATAAQENCTRGAEASAPTLDADVESNGPFVIGKSRLPRRAALTSVGVILLSIVALAWWQLYARQVPLLTSEQFQTALRQGQWIHNADGVSSPAIPCAWYRVDQILPREFVLHIRIERMEGYRAAFVNVSDTNPFTISFSAGVMPLDGSESNSSAQGRHEQSNVFAASWGDWADNSPRLFVLTAGDKSLQLKRNGETIMDWKGDFSEMISTSHPASFPTEPGFYLLTEQSVFRFECSRGEIVQ